MDWQQLVAFYSLSLIIAHKLSYLIVIALIEFILPPDAETLSGRRHPSLMRKWLAATVKQLHQSLLVFAADTASICTLTRIKIARVVGGIVGSSRHVLRSAYHHIALHSVLSLFVCWRERSLTGQTYRRTPREVLFYELPEGDFKWYPCSLSARDVAFLSRAANQLRSESEVAGPNPYLLALPPRCSRVTAISTGQRRSMRLVTRLSARWRWRAEQCHIETGVSVVMSY